MWRMRRVSVESQEDYVILTLLSFFQARADPLTVIFPFLLGLALALVVGITFHEFSHCFAAYRLGDTTPLYQGRLTLNPSAHLDPMGVFVFVLTGFGWGRPAPFNPYQLRTNPRTGTGLVAVAGPTSNVILALVFGLFLRALLSINIIEANSLLLVIAVRTLAAFVDFNLILAVFNLVPLPPLDGSKILPALLPADMAYSLERVYAQLGPYSLFLLLAILYLVPGAGAVLFAPVDTLFSLIVGLPFGAIAF
jgi:Zn-dependent protease